MKTVSTIVLVILIFLAVSSGVSKIVLMQQEVDFFSQYGFSDAALIAFGLSQLLGGLLMVFAKTRFAGAAIVAITFVLSLALLLIEGNIPLSVITLIATLLLGAVMKRTWHPGKP